MSIPGIVLGAFQGRTLRFRGEENVLVVGSARSGKGIGVIIPTCLEMPGHLVVVDIRGETWEQTAGWRASGAGGSRVLRLQLTKPGSTRYNLLDTIRRGTPEEFRDAVTLAEMAVDSGGNKVEERNHWEKTSKALLTCALLYEVHRSWRPTLRNIAHFWSRPDMPILQTLAHVVQTAPTPEVAELAQELLNKDAREGTGVVSSMMTQLFVFRDPVLAANTCTSDFSLDDFLRTTPPWTSLYLVMSPGEEEYVRPFLRMFLRMACQRWLEMGTEKLHMTLLLDEFVSYGRLGFFVHHLAVLGGRGIRTLVAVQNLPQLTQTYGHSDLITEQCKVRLFFAANGQTTGREISRQTGTGTATTIQESTRADGWSWAMADSRTRQHHQHARPLLTESEAMQLPPDVAVIQIAGHPPIWAQKLRFFTHRRWQGRSQIPAPAWRP